MVFRLKKPRHGVPNNLGIRRGYAVAHVGPGWVP